jgi:putative transcriptional regulator
MTGAKNRGSFGERLIRAMEEAVEIRRGRRAAARRYTVTAREANALAAPTITGAEIIRLRRSLGVSQVVFARLLNVSSATTRSWEQNVKQPGGPARRLLEIVAAHPKVLLAFMREKPSIPRHVVQKRLASIRGSSKNGRRQRSARALKRRS